MSRTGSPTNMLESGYAPMLNKWVTTGGLSRFVFKRPAGVKGGDQPPTFHRKLDRYAPQCLGMLTKKAPAGCDQANGL